MEAEKSRLLSDNIELKELGRIFTAPIRQYCYKTGLKNAHPYSILFEFRDGITVKTMDYVNLHSKHYNRNVGIILFFTHATVTIYGSHLDGLFSDVNERKVSSINEYIKGTPANDEVHDRKLAMVNKIDIHYKDEEIEKEIARMGQEGFMGHDKAS